MAQYLVDLLQAASTWVIQRGEDSVSAEQYSAVISVHHAFLIDFFKSFTDVGFSSATQRFNRTQQFNQQGMVHRNNC